MMSGIIIEISPPKKPRGGHPESVGTLTLAPFGPVPKVLFRNVPVGAVQKGMIVLRNPSNRTLHITVEKSPPRDRNVSLYPSSFVIHEECASNLHIIWTPKVAGNWRDVIQLKCKEKNLKLQFVLVCQSVLSSGKPILKKETGTKIRSIGTPAKCSPNVYRVKRELGITFPKARHCVTPSPLRRCKRLTARKENIPTVKHGTSVSKQKLDSRSNPSFGERINVKSATIGKEIPSVDEKVKDPPSLGVEYKYSSDFEFSSCDALATPIRQQTSFQGHDSTPINDPSSEKMKNAPVQVFGAEECEKYGYSEARSVNLSPPFSSDTLNSSLEFETGIAKKIVPSNLKTETEKSSLDKFSMKSEAGSTQNDEQVVDKTTYFRTVRFKVDDTQGTTDVLPQPHRLEFHPAEQESHSIPIPPSPMRRHTLNPNLAFAKAVIEEEESQISPESSFMQSGFEKRPLLNERGSEYESAGRMTDKSEIDMEKEMQEFGVMFDSITFSSSTKEGNRSQCIDTKFKEPLSDVTPVSSTGISKCRAKGGSMFIKRDSSRRVRVPIVLDEESVLEGKSVQEQIFPSPLSWTKSTRLLKQKTSTSTISEQSTNLVHNLPEELGGDISANIYNQDENLDFSSYASPMESNPFLRGYHFNEAELIEETRMYCKWINSLLSPPEELSCDLAWQKVNVDELWQRSLEKEIPADSMVARDVTKKKWMALRHTAASVYSSEEVARVIDSTVHHIDKTAIVVCEGVGNRYNYIDIDLQKKLLRLLLCYNPVWLRVGLETVFDESIPLSSCSDLIGLVTFIRKRFLSDPYLEEKYRDRKVRHQHKRRYDVELRKHIVKKFLTLLYFLDFCKTTRLIQHDPCLFNKDSLIKSSKRLLNEFCSFFLFGDDDLMRNIQRLGYDVSHQQEHVHEYDYAVHHLYEDLSDGIRLLRIAEMLIGDFQQSDSLYVPARSNFEKIHNLVAALCALEYAGCKIDDSIITGTKIIEGNIIVILALLWEIDNQFQKSKPEFATARVEKEKESNIRNVIAPDDSSEDTSSHETVKVEQEKAAITTPSYNGQSKHEVKCEAATMMQMKETERSSKKPTGPTQKWLQRKYKQQEVEKHQNTGVSDADHGGDESCLTEMDIISSIDHISKSKEFSKMVSYLHILNVASSVSPKFSKLIEESGGLKVMYSVVERGNQSQPCLEALTLCTGTLLNMQKWNETECSVWMCQNDKCDLKSNYVVHVLTSTISKYKNHPPIFNNCCDILWRFVQDPVKVSVILDQSHACKYLTYLNKYLGGAGVKEKWKMQAKQDSLTVRQLYMYKIGQCAEIMEKLGIRS